MIHLIRHDTFVSTDVRSTVKKIKEYLCTRCKCNTGGSIRRNVDSYVCIYKSCFCLKKKVRLRE